MTPEDATLICATCAARIPADTPVWRCHCGGILDLDYPRRFDPRAIAGRPPTLWRYRQALPLPAATEPVSFDEGFTPLLKCDMRGCTVHLKHEHRFPTGSYKDRGAAVLITKARQLGIREVVEDSSGNAGCAIAAYAAAARMTCHIYIPEETAAAKLAQIQAYGAVLHKVPGSRDDTAQAALAAAQNTYYASHVWNPFFLQGTKTFAYEICEQLDWQSPDALVLPVGNGTLLLGAALGFQELYEAGHIQARPRLVAVQAANCAPLAQAYANRVDELPPTQTRPTLAEGIAIPHPLRGKQILAAVRKRCGPRGQNDQQHAHWDKSGFQHGFGPLNKLKGVHCLSCIIFLVYAGGRPGILIAGTLSSRRASQALGELWKRQGSGNSGLSLECNPFDSIIPGLFSYFITIRCVFFLSGKNDSIN